MAPGLAFLALAGCSARASAPPADPVGAPDASSDRGPVGIGEAGAGGNDGSLSAADATDASDASTVSVSNGKLALTITPSELTLAHGTTSSLVLRVQFLSGFQSPNGATFDVAGLPAPSYEVVPMSLLGPGQSTLRVLGNLQAGSYDVTVDVSAGAENVRGTVRVAVTP